MYPDSNVNFNYETEDAVFWFSTAFDPLNNWSAHQVHIWGRAFATVEHAYHFRKYRETAPDVAEEIASSPSPWAAFQTDRKQANLRRTDWNDVKVDIMTEIVRAKVTQNEDVRMVLLATGTKRIVENSPWDSFWGIGPNGDGKNQMGRILMQLRSELGKTA